MYWLRKNWMTLLLTIMALVGASLIAYPTFADWWNNFHQARAVASYAEAVANLDQADYEKILKEAEKYNKRLAKTGANWQLTEEELEEYNNQLKINETGIMGYIDIPKINITLPIYHGIDEKVLQVAIGHIAGTSLPVGGKGSHCVVSGHRGLPSARLFTDLDKLVEGDTWTMTVLGKTVTYEVDQIRVVEPTDLSELQIKKNKDYCTLVTCTPYGINTHRLLVRGHRVDNAQGDADVIADAMLVESTYIIPFIAVPVLLLLFIIAMVVTGRQAKVKNIWTSVRRVFEEQYNSEE